MRARLLCAAIAASLTACGYSGPPCETVDVSDLVVDTSGEVPVFSWGGDAIDDLFVQSAAGDAWDVSCALEDRSCLASPITYGEAPNEARADDNDGAYRLDPAELVSGETYRVSAAVYCEGEDEEDVTLTAEFTMP